MDVEIYCGNLYVGGPISGAASLVNLLPRLRDDDQLGWADRWRVVVSSRVAQEVTVVEQLRIAGIEYVVRDDPPKLLGTLGRRPVAVDARLCFRGPEYAPEVGAINVAGFADPTMLEKTPQGVRWGASRRARLQVKNVFKRRVLKTYDAHIVQTELMKRTLRGFGINSVVTVVRNSPSQVLTDPDQWTSVGLPPRAESEVRLFYPARGYPHKNHRVIPEVAAEFSRLTGNELRVVTTLRDYELAGLPPGTRSFLLNVGELHVEQLGSLYRACDGVFFPTLNEVSSATPLEGMLLRRPVFASDREFVRETAGGAPFYFDPLDPSDIAACLAGALADSTALREHMDVGTAVVDSLPTPYERASAYVGALRSAVGSTPGDKRS